MTLNKRFIILLSLANITLAAGQSRIEWSMDSRLRLEDFQSPQTEISEQTNTYSIFSGSSLELGFNMAAGQFMFTKNFNSAVSNVFNRNMAAIIAPDSLIAQKLVDFGQYSFDVTELYARKLRREMYEEKKTFSDYNFFQPMHQTLTEQLNAEIARVLKITDLGRKSELLQEEHRNVLRQIEELSDFCKVCRPSKRRRR